MQPVLGSVSFEIPSPNTLSLLGSSSPIPIKTKRYIDFQLANVNDEGRPVFLTFTTGNGLPQDCLLLFPSATSDEVALSIKSTQGWTELHDKTPNLKFSLRVDLTGPTRSQDPLGISFVLCEKRKGKCTPLGNAFVNVELRSTKWDTPLIHLNMFYSSPVCEASSSECCSSPSTPYSAPCGSPGPTVTSIPPPQTNDDSNKEEKFCTAEASTKENVSVENLFDDNRATSQFIEAFLQEYKAIEEQIPAITQQIPTVETFSFNLESMTGQSCLPKKRKGLIDFMTTKKGRQEQTIVQQNPLILNNLLQDLFPGVAC